jgi:hypothetical protein
MTPSTMRGITRGTCHHCGKFTDDGLVQSFRMCSHRCCDEHESLRADLLVTKRALKMAQARALRYLAGCYRRRGSEPSLRIENKNLDGVYISGPHKGLSSHERCARTMLHYAAKFEAEAGEMTCR